MKAIHRYIKPALAGLVAAFMFPGCLQEIEPTSNATQEEVDKGDKTGLMTAVAAYLNTYNSSYSYDIGFMGFNIWRDASTSDMPVYSTAYDYFTYVEMCTYLGSEWAMQYTIWQRYYFLIQKANLVLNAIDVETYPEDAVPAVTALAYRANAYMELAQWYEYKKTGVAAFDSQAEADGIMGLTVPIVTESTTEEDSRHNPRVPFYTIYRFILSDLNKGEKYGAGATQPDSKTYPGIGVVYGLQARLWQLIGTRFELHPEDLATALSHENDTDIPYDALGVTTSRECFVKAAEYARKAINCGYTPVTETQWFDPTTGFNSVNNSWMWANIITTNNGLATTLTWQSWVSFMSPEATYGVATTGYGAYRMIDARLFGTIPDSDWRKPTWIAPEDASNQQAFNSKYARGTSLSYTEWKDFAPYTAFKFHPANGDRNTSTIGNAVSMPLMRVEEMYLIEAEAVGRSQGDAAGRALLESFVNTYRYTDASYKSTGAGLDGFIDDVFNQKRIELWGEGQILWDFKRLEKAIEKGYPGTNHSDLTRFNWAPNLNAPWTTLTIPKAEVDFNNAVLPNPDPSHTGYYDLWSE